MLTSPSSFDRTSDYFEETVDEERILTICTILSNRRRQLVVHFLLGESDDEWVSTGEVARWIAAIDEGCPADHAQGKHYRSVRTSLIQTHLSTLAETGIIEYKSDRNQLRRGDSFGRVADSLLTLACNA